MPRSRDSGWSSAEDANCVAFVDLTLPSPPAPAPARRRPPQHQHLSALHKKEPNGPSINSEHHLPHASRRPAPLGHATSQINPAHVRQIIDTSHPTAIRNVLLSLCNLSPALSGAVARGLAPHSTFAQETIRDYQGNAGPANIKPESEHARPSLMNVKKGTPVALSVRPLKREASYTSLSDDEDDHVAFEQEASHAHPLDDEDDFPSEQETAHFYEYRVDDGDHNILFKREASFAESSDDEDLDDVTNGRPGSFARPTGRSHPSRLNNAAILGDNAQINLDHSRPSRSSTQSRSQTRSIAPGGGSLPPTIDRRRTVKTKSEAASVGQTCTRCRQTFQGSGDDCVYHPGRKRMIRIDDGEPVPVYTCCEDPSLYQIAGCSLGPHTADLDETGVDHATLRRPAGSSPTASSRMPKRSKAIL